jgi:twitching motility two-component system response regulator PilH
LQNASVRLLKRRYKGHRLEIMSTVLVVEDSVAQREMIKDLLESSGLEVTAVSDGFEALRFIQGHPPDLVLLDIVMPKMNGYEVCRRIKSNANTKMLPVVMCSSKGEEFDRYWGMKQGADAYIAKPFQPTELVGTVKQLLLG